jgi:hypothetical protein
VTWISIDPDQAVTIGRAMVSAAQDTTAELDQLSVLGDTVGLGPIASLVASEIGASRSAIIRNTEQWLGQGLDMLNRLQTLVNDQQASAVIGTVSGPIAVAAGVSAVTISGGPDLSYLASTPTEMVTVGGGTIAATALDPSNTVSIGGSGVAAGSTSEADPNVITVPGGGPIAAFAGLGEPRTGDAAPTGDLSYLTSIDDSWDALAASDDLANAPVGAGLSTDRAGPGYEVWSSFGDTSVISPIGEDAS